MRQVGEEAQRAAAGTDAEFLTYFIGWLDGRVFESASVFVLCFSEAHNQLSQWRGYTQHGRGICLSIDSALLVQRMQTNVEFRLADAANDLAIHEIMVGPSPT